MQKSMRQRKKDRKRKREEENPTPEDAKDGVHDFLLRIFAATFRTRIARQAALRFCHKHDGGGSQRAPLCRMDDVVSNPTDKCITRHGTNDCAHGQ